MNKYTVEFRNRSFDLVKAPGVEITPTRWSAHSKRGPLDCEIEVTGQLPALWEMAQWLRYELIIRNEFGTRCWWGCMTGIDITNGATTIGISLDEMYNRVAVRYSYEAPGGQLSGETAWTDDAASVAVYGIKELMQNESETTPAEAADLASTILDYKGLPIGTVAFSGPSASSGTSAEGQPTARIYGKGWVDTLAWRYLNIPQGRILHEDGGTEQTMGYGFTESLGFKRHENTIHSLTGKFLDLPVGARIEISGLASNNGTFTVSQATGDAVATYTASTISFEVSDDILDGASGLGFVRNHELIYVTGSSGNSGYHRTDGAEVNHVTTDTAYGGVMSNEDAGPSVTIDQGNSIVVEENVITAVPSATATVVAHGKKIDQTFTLTEAGSFTIGEVIVRLRKVGTPTGGVTVGLRTDTAGVPNFPAVEAITVAAADISEDMDDILFVFAHTSSVTFGTTYHIVVEVAGGVDSATGYYMVDVDESEGYTGGTLKVWTGSAWVARSPAASLSFQIWGHQQTTSQITTLVSTAGQFGLDVDIRNASGKYTRQYRDGVSDALTELDALLDRGTTNDKRLMVRLPVGGRTMIIEEEPAAAPNNDLIWRSDAKLYWPTGAPFEPGVLPVARWVTLADVPASVNSVAKISPVFVEQAAYDATGERHEITPRGARSVWDLGKIING